MKKGKNMRILAAALTAAVTITLVPGIVEAEEESTQEHGNGFEQLNEKWFTANGDWNHYYAPNAIDPTAFFDKNDDLYMVYGSWSGGIFILPLDRETGEVLYPGQDGIQEESGNFTDRYFGTHIAGGNHQSGEGPFIVYDKETDYYYLYESYGELSTYGGYNMRLFRSKNVYGPYLDAKGNNAADSGKTATKNFNEKYGIKLIGNYQFKDQPAFYAAGHNSVLYDEGGSRYLVYHQRFDESETGHLAHEVRIHQQFMNEDDWPVTAVYEYSGEKTAHYEDSQVVGTYQVVDHGTGNSGKLCETKTVKLNADGTISGDMEGTWEKSEGPDRDFVTLTSGSDTYKGIFFKQTDESDKRAAVMTFTVIGDNNTALWGSGLEDGGAEEGKKAERARVMVHDPSIIKGKDGTYYVYGSHLASAGSKDLMKWEQITPDAGLFNWKQDSIYGDILTNLAGSFAWAGYNDGDVLGDHVGVWAPHIIWDPYYQNEDKTMGAYLDYYCTSSTWRRSCIGYAISKELTGDYRYTDTVIYSGFTKNGAVDGKGSRNTKWDNDYLNLTKLIDHYHNRYYLSYDKNAAQLGNDVEILGEMEGQTVKSGEGALVEACAFAAEGYEFTGWNTKADGTGYSWDEDNWLDLEADMTLYAQWKKTTSGQPDTPDTPDTPVTPENTGKTDVPGKASDIQLCAGVEYQDVKTNAVYKVSATGNVNRVTYLKPLAKKGNVKIPDRVVLNGKICVVTEIADNAFAKDNRLTNVTIGDQIIKIGNKAFYGCRKLKKAVIGKNVTTIGKQAFANDKKLKNIHVKTAALATVGSKAFKGIHAKAVIKTPGKKKKKYEKLLKKKGLPKTAGIR